jgi:SAM-dependent methyltransferase
MPESEPESVSESFAGSAAYTDWKNWNQGFGTIAKGDLDYFSRELRRITQRGPLQDVLEVGFGNGGFLGYCRTQGWQVIGTELSAAQVASGRMAGFEVYLSEETDAFAMRSFDLIAAFDVLEHIAPDDGIKFLTELANRLRPEGHLYLRYPNADTWLGNPHQYGDPTHVNAIGYHKMEFLAQGAGLRIVEYRAPIRRGFSTSVIHGIHALTAGPIIKAIAGVQKALYFPGLPYVLSAPSVVCVLARGERD